jgi:hypothetical protein
MLYWSRFQTTHPLPPEDIEGRQVAMSERALRQIQRIEQGRSPAQRTTGNVETAFADERNTAVGQLGYPLEALTRDAAQWAYILRKRQEFADFQRSSEVANQSAVEEFFAKVYVDRKLITDPLTPKQLEAANAWKIAYLRRLRAQKTDESYINAYMTAWGLDPKVVFTEP